MTGGPAGGAAGFAAGGAAGLTSLMPPFGGLAVASAARLGAIPSALWFDDEGEPFHDDNGDAFEFDAAPFAPIAAGAEWRGLEVDSISITGRRLTISFVDPAGLVEPNIDYLFRYARVGEHELAIDSFGHIDVAAGIVAASGVFPVGVGLNAADQVSLG